MSNNNNNKQMQVNLDGDLVEQYKQLIQQASQKIEQVEDILAYEFVPPLSRLLKRMYPDWESKQFADQIYIDMNAKWKTSTIYKKLDSSCYDDEAVRRAKKAWETKNKKKLESVESDSTELIKEAPKEPPITIEEPKEEEPSGEGTVSEPQEPQLPTPEDCYKVGMKAVGKLWESLANIDHLPGPAEDLVNDYLKPSDKFRLRMWKGLGEQESTVFHNQLVYANKLVNRALDKWDETHDGSKELRE